MPPWKPPQMEFQSPEVPLSWKDILKFMRVFFSGRGGEAWGDEQRTLRLRVTCDLVGRALAGGPCDSQTAGAGGVELTCLLFLCFSASKKLLKRKERKVNVL